MVKKPSQYTYISQPYTVYYEINLIVFVSLLTLFTIKVHLYPLINYVHSFVYLLIKFLN